MTNGDERFGVSGHTFAPGDHVLPMETLDEKLFGSARHALWVLQGAVAFVLLIASGARVHTVRYRDRTRLRLAPLLHLRRPAVGRLLIEQKARTTSGRLTTRHAFVVGKVALAAVLVIGAGLMLRTVVNLTRIDLGFDRSQLVTFGIQLPVAKYRDFPQGQQSYERVLDGLRGVSVCPASLRCPAFHRDETSMPTVRISKDMCLRLKRHAQASTITRR